MKLEAEADHPGMLAERHNSYLTGRDGWVERLVDWRDRILAPVENLAKMICQQAARQSSH